MASHINNKYATDALSVRSVELYVWRLFAQKLNTVLTLEQRQAWVSKLKEAYAGSPEALAAMACDAVNELVWAINLLEERGTARDVARSWLKANYENAKDIPAVAALLRAACVTGDSEMTNIMDSIEQRWLQADQQLKVPLIAYGGIIRAYLDVRRNDKAKQWALRALKAAVTEKNLSTNALYEVAGLLVMSGLAVDGTGHDSYAAALAKLARQGKVSDEMPWYYYDFLARPLGTPITRWHLRQVLKTESGTPRLEVAYILSWSYAYSHRMPEWSSFLGKEAANSNGDNRALWLLARAYAESIPIRPFAAKAKPSVLSGKTSRKLIDEALVAAASPACRLRVIRELTESMAVAGMHREAIGVVDSLAEQFAGTDAASELASLRESLASYEAREASHRLIDNRKYLKRVRSIQVSVLRGRLDEATKRGDRQAVEQYEQALRRLSAQD